MTERDLPLLYRWLGEPHVREFYDLEPTTFDGVKERYIGRIRGDDPTHPYIAYLDDAPLGYFQAYLISDHPSYAQHVDVGENAAGVDMLIGEPTHVGCGRGPVALAQFVDEIVWPITGASVCWIGPSTSNARAIRAYEKAGFIYIKTVQVPGEPRPEYLMRLEKPDRGY